MAASVLKVLAPALLCCVATFPGKADADTITVDLPNVRSAQGMVFVSLCADPKAQFPGSCMNYRGTTRAAAGPISVRVDGVPAGRYAVQAFHDENGNLRPDIPPEGYAFGNNQNWPVTFDAAAVQVQGDTRTQLSLFYLGAANTQQGAAAAGGVAPPAGVTRIDVRERGLFGALYVPTGGKPAPALLLVGGSEGGVETISRMATSFARAGFPTLALAYWGAPGLPASLENIPLESFDQAIAWLQARQFRGVFQHLDYPAAGHAVFVGDPSDPAARGIGAPNPMMGGTAAGNEAAWQDNWPRTVGFLRAQLKVDAR
jgi:uncharacterized protein (DUF2141 family)/dienelactone hydrolase